MINLVWTTFSIELLDDRENQKVQTKPTLEDGILEIFSPIKTISCSSSFLFLAIFKNSQK